MKNIKLKALALLGSVAPFIALAEDYDWDEYGSTTTDAEAAAGLAIFGGLFFIWIIVMLVGLAFFIFWIVMLIDCIKREFEQKNTWLIILIASTFLGLSWLSAILYYFMVKRKGLGTNSPSQPTPPQSQPEEQTPPQQPKSL